MLRLQSRRPMDSRLRGNDSVQVIVLTRALELCHECLGSSRKQPNIRTYGDEQTTGVQPFARVGFRPHHDARRLTRFADSRDAIGNRRLHFGMTRIDQMPKIRREILWADEHAINAGCRRDRVKLD